MKKFLFFSFLFSLLVLSIIVTGCSTAGPGWHVNAGAGATNLWFALSQPAQTNIVTVTTNGQPSVVTVTVIPAVNRGVKLTSPIPIPWSAVGAAF